MKAPSQTPLMRQYTQIKERHPDTILLFRLGDFYETFGDDAVATAKACGITLTKRNNGAAGDMPLAGFPHHQLDAYLPKLVAGGHRVAVCEQLEDPKLAKGIVKRDVVEVVTPGVVMYDKLLDTRRNTFIASLVPPDKDGQLWGIAVADVSTGTFSAGEVPADKVESLLESYAPAELLLSKDSKTQWEPVVRRLPSAPSLSRLEGWHFDLPACNDVLVRHFATASLKGFGLQDMPQGIRAAGVIIHYVSESQKRALSQLQSLNILRTSDIMVLDASTRRNLEIQSAHSAHATSGTLIDILDETVTPMGARMLRLWTQTPLTDIRRIEKRQQAVEILRDSPVTLDAYFDVARRIGDLERILTKVVTNRANARDITAMRCGLLQIPEVLRLVNELNNPVLERITSTINPHIDLCKLLCEALEDEPPIAIGTGSMFRRGFHNTLDQASDALKNGKEWIADYQQKERDATGISSLKVSYTNVFGYYIEVSNTHRSKVPEGYERRQTLANAERYTTGELKQLEQQLLSAEQVVSQMEAEILQQLRDSITMVCASLQQACRGLATIDVLASFARVANKRNFVRPDVNDGEELTIEDARHPVIEHLLPPGTVYVPNSIEIDTTTSQIHILTGPNMSGKSSYLRQVGICVYLAHLGACIPAKSARIPLTDRIFTRVGAQDNILAGESTFLVEMQETANILNNATKKSLILLDEVGRGTATFDGISIAWALAEHLHDRVGAKTIFATHYHELTDLAERFERIKNYQVEVREIEQDILFTHRVVPGHSDHSFGIHVAKMAGLPPVVVATARMVLSAMEGRDQKGPATMPQHQISLFEVREDRVRSILENIDTDNMTPIQALQTLIDLRRSLND